MREDTNSPARPLLTTRDLEVVTAPGRATEPLSLSLFAGQFFGISWGLGRGKSIVAEVIAGVARPGIGVRGELIVDPREIEFVPEDARLRVLSTDRVGALLETARLAADRAGRPRPNLSELLARLRLTGSRIPELEFRTLSSSERERVSIALALLGPGRVLVLDGSGQGLDAEDRRAVAGLLRDELERGRAVLHFSRRPDAFEGLSDTSLASPPSVGAVPLLRRTDTDEEEEPERATSLLEVERLRVRRTMGSFGRTKQVTPLDGASLFVRHGEILVVYGAGGSGKTTLLETIAGLTRPASGRIFFEGRDVTPARGLFGTRREKSVQLVFQDASVVLDPLRTVREHLVEARRLLDRKRPGRERRRDANPTEWLERVGLSGELLDRPADFLSSGEAQRVLLARSLALEPRLLLLDAPRVSGIDVDGGVLAALLHARKRGGTGFLVATNDAEIARSLGDRVAVLHAGRVVELGAKGSVLDRPAHPVTRALLEGRLETLPEPERPARGCPYVTACPRRLLPTCDENEPLLAPRPGRLTTLGRHRVACFHPIE